MEKDVKTLVGELPLVGQVWLRVMVYKVSEHGDMSQSHSPWYS